MPPKKKKVEKTKQTWSKEEVLKGEKLFHNLCSTCHSLASISTGPALGKVYN